MNSFHQFTNSKSYLAAKDKLAKKYTSSRISAQEYLSQYSQVTDQLITSVYSHSELHESCALLALGGYGRAEFYPFSDIDILILVKNSNKIDEEKISYFLHQLWDLKIKIGHALRTINESVDLSTNDITVQTSLLDARLICGNENLYQDLIKKIAKKLNLPEFINAKLLEQKHRHHRFQYVDSPLEPNIKESPGGLRELHLLGFIYRAIIIKNNAKKENLQTANFIEYWQHQDWIAQEELAVLMQNRNFLQELRINLHLQSYRANDILLFDYQKKLADIFIKKYQKTFDQKLSPNERLMKKYYQVAMKNLQLNKLLIDNLIDLLATKAKTKSNTRYKKLEFGLAITNKNEIDVLDVDIFSQNPENLLKPYLWKSQGDDYELTPRLKRLINKLCLYLEEFRNHPTLKNDFLNILKLPNRINEILRELNQMGFLGGYIKPFGNIVGQMQFDLYHAYTVDQHTLMVIRNLTRLIKPEFNHELPEHSSIIASFSKPWLLIIAALFHDIAKGRGGNHSIMGMQDARNFCLDHKLQPEDQELVVWLVKEHLLMSKLSQTVDLADAKVIANFCNQVDNSYRLDALYLLTVADIRGTSPIVWTPWKDKLLSTLYQNALDFLENKDNDSKIIKHFNPKNEIRNALFKKGWLSSQINNIIRGLHQDYLSSFELEEIIWHITSIQKINKTKMPLVIRKLPKISTSNIQQNQYLQLLLIDAENDQSLFGKVCGHLSLMYFSVLKAQNLLWYGNSKILFFQIQPVDLNTYIEKKEINQIKKELKQRLSENSIPQKITTRTPRHILHSRFKPQVSIIPDINEARYVITVSAFDRLGLLYNLILYFNEFNINIIHARINTLGERVENSFVIESTVLHKTKIIYDFENGLLKLLQNY